MRHWKLIALVQNSDAAIHLKSDQGGVQRRSPTRGLPKPAWFDPATKTKGVSMVVVTLGRYDGAIAIKAESFEKSMEVAKGLLELPGVKRLETLIVAPHDH
ncbi:MAG: hypothetical protein HY556_10910 [Euryarchaeota archaeon]|nr:hypothetical protein [Euryarchaeota archaeon]